MNAIELRWLNRIAEGTVVFRETVLQYRERRVTNFAGIDLPGEWSEWKDVPTVRDGTPPG